MRSLQQVLVLSSCLVLALGVVSSRNKWYPRQEATLLDTNANGDKYFTRTHTHVPCGCATVVGVELVTELTAALTADPSCVTLEKNREAITQ